MQPIYLLADSQLLFHRSSNGSWLDRIRAQLEPEQPRAVYIGASNGDAPEFFELFQAAMGQIGVKSCRAIPSQPSPADLESLGSADLVLLAGGDVAKGWGVIVGEGMLPRILESYYGGGVLMGVSAGAVQLGLGWPDGDEAGNGSAHLLETSKLVPRLIDVHSEPEWERLASTLHLVSSSRDETPGADGWRVGLGIPSGGGAIFHPGSTLEAVRFPLQELQIVDGDLKRSLVFPPSVDSPGVDSPSVDSPER